MREIMTAAVLAIGLNQWVMAGETVVDDRYLSDREQGENWAGYGRTYFEQRYSPLDAINADNVEGLGIDWYLDLPNDRSLTGTPLAIDGVLYFNPGAAGHRRFTLPVTVGRLMVGDDGEISAEIIDLPVEP